MLRLPARPLRHALGLSLLLGAACSSPRCEVASGAERPAPPWARPRAETQTESSPTPLPTGPVTRDFLVAHGLAASPDLAAARARASMARAAIGVARSGQEPTLSLGLEALRADAPSLFLFKRIDARRLPPGVDFNAPGAFSSVEAGLTFRQTLWDGRRTPSRVTRAEESSAASEFELAAARADLVAALMEGDAARVAAERAMEVAAASLELVARQLEVQRTLFEQGRALRSDVLSLEVRLEEARETWVVVQGARDNLAATLLDAAGLSQDTPLAPAMELVESEEVDATEPDEDELQERARNRRPELAAARRHVRAAEAAREGAQAAFRPRLDLFGRLYRVDDGFDLDDREDNWALGLTFDWDILAGGRRDAELEAAKAGELEARARERRARAAVEREVRAALVDLRSARARVAAGRTGAHLAAENLELVAVQFETGRVPVTRFLEAEAALLSARLRRIEAQRDLERAAIALERAVGTLLDPAASPAP